MKLLVTGCAGFIGWKVSEKLLNEGHEVIGVDNLNDYYDVKLKFYRLKLLKKYKK
jgi:nucleoside-diphosphate-sugar epimerase